MKKYLLTLLMVLIVAALFAQKKAKQKSSWESDKRYHELEFNTVFLLQEIFGSGNPKDLRETYLVGYKTGKGNVGFRFGLGADFIWRSEQESTIDKRGLTEYLLRARLGIEWRKKIMDRWYLITGLDGVVESSFSEDVTTTSFDKISSSNQENAIGAGPVVGIRFLLNEKISLATETALHAFYIRRVEEIDSQNLPEFDEKKVIFEYPVRFDPPVNLYLIVRF